jgi:putative hemolysin
MDDAAATEYIRSRTVLLESREEATRFRWSLGSWPAAAIAEPIDSAVMEKEIAAVSRAGVLVRAQEFLVCVATASQIPETLREIGRLREIAFRHAGEGTGTSRDLDSFDKRYEHLILWNEEKCEVVGAYRIARTDRAMEQDGVCGLHTNSLFRLDPEFCAAVRPALELGRSFVRVEYQKSYLPLLLLWKALGQFVVRNPQYRVLFGPVSISEKYCSASRALMVSFLRARYRDEAVSRCVHPRNEFRCRNLTGWNPDDFSSLIENLDELSQVVADLELDHKGIPVLLRHYLHLGGRILGFNVDRKFSSVVDGLVMVDLAKAGRRQLERYMGKADAEQFVRHHKAI